jgi:hypothetical protein
MASYRGHLTLSSVLGAAYGGWAAYQWQFDWGDVFLGAGLTTLGGVLPDLDSDSGVPVRELFGLSAAVVSLVAYPHIREQGFTLEQTLALLGGLYLFIRYGLSRVFRHWTVHRGMFHSIPAMLIAGLITYLALRVGGSIIRLYLAGGVMLGFLSHLVLDELYSVDFMGMGIRLNRYAGSALKLFSASFRATLVCYLLLGSLGYLAWKDWERQLAERERWNLPWQRLSEAVESPRPSLLPGWK